MSIRRKFSVLAAAAFLLAAGTASAYANYVDAKRHFDSLTIEDRLEITLGLIGTGDFSGLADFGFTKRYYNSLLAFEAREGLIADGVLDGSELSRLKLRSGQFFTALNVAWRDHPFAGSKLLVPLGLFDTEFKTGHGLTYERDDKNLSLSFVGYVSSDRSFAQLYEQLASDTKQRKIAYKRLKSSYFVANGTFRDRNFYTWMSAVPGGSTGFTLAWSDGWDSTGSKLSVLLANAFIPQSNSSVASAPSTTPVQPPIEEPKAEPPAADVPSLSTGTGFKVTAEGHVLTNFHVAGECKSITLRKPGELPVEAALVGGDQLNDLALVKAKTGLSGDIAQFRSGPAPKAGADVVVFGFPLSDILASGGNVVTGNITALAGLANDSRQYQISAPVQPGNSGGPVIDRQGHVVAVVVAKLNALKMAANSGDVPQNINFAIKSSVATTFLDGNSIAYQTGETGTDLDTPALAEKAQRFTYLIECRN